MRPTKLATVAFAATLAAALLAACSSSSTSPSSSSSSHVTLNYWATNQGTSLQDDESILGPQIAKFTAQTGIKVNLTVLPWTTVLNQVTAATVSGKGPDVLNIGNTWSPTLQATGALLPFTPSVMSEIGGPSRFLAGSLSATGAPGKPPVAVPLYSLAYALYYNKAQFAAAGISGPPTTWAQLIADGKKLTGNGHYGLAIEGGSVSENIHLAFELSQQQGGAFFSSAGQPTFDTPQNVAAIMQMMDFIQTDKITNPSDAQYSKGTEAQVDYATGKASMVIWQASAGSLAKDGMNSANIGVAQHLDDHALAEPDHGARHRSANERRLDGGGHQHGDLQGHPQHVRGAEVREVHDEHTGAGGSQLDLRIAAHGVGRLQRPGVQDPGREHVQEHPQHQRRADAGGAGGELVRDRGGDGDRPPVR